MEYSILLLTLVFLQCPIRCGGAETELCYLRHGDSNANICGEVKSTGPCCIDHTSNIMVTVYMKNGCNSLPACQSGERHCCTKSKVIPVNDDHKMELVKQFMTTNCFRDVTSDYVVSSMPNSTGLDLVVVSYSCIDSSSKVAAAVAVPVTIVVVAAVVVGTIFYMRRRRSRKDAPEQLQENHANKAQKGFVSKSEGFHLNAFSSTKAEDQETNDYAEIADNSLNFNHSLEEGNRCQSIKPIETTANDEPRRNRYTTAKDPTGEDEYDHLGTQDTPRSNNYEHITHISKDDNHYILYDKNEYNQGNTICFDEEDNYNHARQNGAAGRIETDDRDGDYSHVGGTVDGPRADDQYNTMESVLDTQDSSHATHNYFVLEKQYKQCSDV